MVILDVRMHNIYAFKNFHMNLTYPKKIVGSSIVEEHLDGHPNFRYKKVNIIMGANASGKTTFGRALMKIFNFLSQKNYFFVTDVIGDRKKEASFAIDMACERNIFYRICCKISPSEDDKYTFNGFGKTWNGTVDYIWYKGFKRCHDFKVIVRKYNHVPFISDHYPIRADLEF